MSSASDVIYLDNAATTFPKPLSVTKEVVRCMTEYCGNPGRGSHRLALEASEALYGTREKLDALFNGYGPEYCVFTLNTTYALIIALKSTVRPGCRILISDLEHNSVYRQAERLRTLGIEYDIFTTFGSDAAMTAEEINRKITKNTAVLICLLSSNICGSLMPVQTIGKLCRDHDITFIADAAQSAGVYETDMKRMNIDALCVPSHKGLYGPQGAAAVLFSERIGGRLSTFIEGGSGSDSTSPFMPSVLPDRFEAGTMPTPAVAGLGKGIDFVASYGIGNLRRHEEELSSKLRRGIVNDGRFTVYSSDDSAGIVLFNIKGIPSVKVSEELDSFGICTRAGFHCAPLAHRKLGTGDSGAVRVSFGAFNRPSDVDFLLERLFYIAKNK